MGIQEDIRIGHSGDALALLDQLLSDFEFEENVKKALEAIRDAIERGII